MNEPTGTGRADLHIHTALSPCGSDEMTPLGIIEAALEAGLEMIAICDIDDKMLDEKQAKNKRNHD